MPSTRDLLRMDLEELEQLEKAVKARIRLLKVQGKNKKGARGEDGRAQRGGSPPFTPRTKKPRRSGVLLWDLCLSDVGFLKSLTPLRLSAVFVGLEELLPYEKSNLLIARRLHKVVIQQKHMEFLNGCIYPTHNILGCCLVISTRVRRGEPSHGSRHPAGSPALSRVDRDRWSA